MSSTTSLIRNILVVGAVALGAVLLKPAAASAAGCIAQDFGDGSYCVGCDDGACWGAYCTDGSQGYYESGCRPAPPRPIYA
jgi:hypothetical protein